MLFVFPGDPVTGGVFVLSFSVPLKEKKLLEVKLGELPSWILMRDFTPSGIAGAFQRGYYRYYNKYVNEKRGSIAGLSLVLAAYAVSATAVLTRSANKSGYASEMATYSSILA